MTCAVRPLLPKQQTASGGPAAPEERVEPARQLAVDQSRGICQMSAISLRSRLSAGNHLRRAKRGLTLSEARRCSGWQTSNWMPSRMPARLAEVVDDEATCQRPERASPRASRAARVSMPPMPQAMAGSKIG